MVIREKIRGSMYLKRLEIRGFKSFYPKTVLDFLSPQEDRHSITAIVGPNGSGKSNISDAILWVMGEQSLKQLRGKKSEDVIFSGSEIKGQLSSAEVTMILDNSDGRLLADYPEIIITRRLYRSGEAEYLINNSSVRLLDIHLLLAKAQFAQHSYSVIKQGMIDRLLMVSPAERKDFIDEASGIKEFKIKQHQAELKLARTRENIDQAQRLMQEVEPRLRLLSRQVKKLQKRQEVKLELRESQEQYYSSIYLVNKAGLDKLKLELDGVQANYHSAFTELKNIQEELANLARASTRQQVFEELQSQYQSLVRSKHELERQLAVKEGQLQAGYSKEGKQNVAWLESKVTELQVREGELKREIKNLEDQADKLNLWLAQARKRSAELSVKQTNCQLEIGKLQQQIIASQTEQNWQQQTGLLAVRAVIENRSQFGKVYRLFAELGEVAEKYLVALDVAAGSYLGAVVVEDEEVAGRAIEFLRANRLGFATFLPLNKISALANQAPSEILSLPGVHGLAVDLIKCQAKFSQIFSFVFKDTLIIEDLSVAKKVGIGKYRLVTLAGDMIDKSGVMRGGYRQARKSGLSFFQKLSLGQDGLAELQAELVSQKQGLTELAMELESNREEILQTEHKHESAVAKIELLTSEQNKLWQEIAGLEQDLKMWQVDAKDYSGILDDLITQKQELNNQIRAREKAVSQLADKIAKFNQAEEQKKQKVFALQATMQAKQDQVNEILLVRNELGIKLARLETKQDSLVEEVRAEMGSSIESIIVRGVKTVAEGELVEINGRLQKLKYQLSLIGGIDDEVMEEHRQTKEKYDWLASQINDLSKAMADLEQMVIELAEVMKKKRAAAFKKIRQEFVRYTKILFAGGTADMREIRGEVPADETVVEDGGSIEEFAETSGRLSQSEEIVTGVEVMVNPPGKKIKHINTLSGGERTLASIALICAVLSYNPAPFVVLDEVEAALDEINTRRFSQIVAELAKYSQFIIITHNRVTMSAADALYGVTMGSDGISKLLSVKLEEAQTVKNNFKSPAR